MGRLRNEISMNGKKFTIPSSWNGCSFDELKIIAECWGMMIADPEVIEESDVIRRSMVMLREFMKISQNDMKAISPEDMTELIKLVRWIFIEKVSYNQSPPERLKIGLKKFIGPSKGLTTSSFDEFIFADTAFLAYSQNQDYNALWLLAATLYRSKRMNLKSWKDSEDYNGDNREPFNPTKIKKQAKYLKTYMNLYDAMAIMYFYWGFRNENVLKFSILFKEGDDDENSDDEQNEKSQNKGNGWVGTRLAISGKKFGDFKNTGKTNWRTILYEMSERAIEEKERQKKIREQNLKMKM